MLGGPKVSRLRKNQIWLELEDQLECKLDVPAFVRIDRGHALLGVNSCCRRQVVVAKRQPHVGVIQQIKEFSANLQTKSLSDFCSLINAEVDGISAGAIKVATAQHILRKWTEVGDSGDRVDVRAVKAGTEVKVVEGVRSAAGVRPGGTGFRMEGCLDRPHASREGVCAIEQGEWETTADRDDGGSCPSIQESFSRASHVPRERNVPGARKYEAVTLVEIGIAFVNLRVERIQESEICIVVGLAEG